MLQSTNICLNCQVGACLPKGLVPNDSENVAELVVHHPMLPPGMPKQALLPECGRNGIK